MGLNRSIDRALAADVAYVRLDKGRNGIVTGAIGASGGSNGRYSLFG